MGSIYDVVIIGSGPAGLSAGIYAGRYRLNTLIIEKGANGGQAVLTSDIENYPGVFNGAGESGQAIMERMKRQAVFFGAKFHTGEVTKVSLDGNVKSLELSDGCFCETRTVIIAGGAHFKPIGCKNEDRFVGCGISYCATCDANFFSGLDVYVAGGGDSAIEEAIYLSNVARTVTVIHRRDSFRASEYAVKKAEAVPNISFLMDSVVDEADGEDVLNEIKVRNLKTGELKVIKADDEDGMIGLFGFVGMEPETAIYRESGLKLKDGYIEAGEDTCTNIRGVFAAGDIRTKELRQVVTAAADGANAAFMAHKLLSGFEAQ